MNTILYGKQSVFNPDFKDGRSQINLERKEQKYVHHNDNEPPKTVLGRLLTWVKSLLSQIMLIMLLIYYGWTIVKNWKGRNFNEYEAAVYRNEIQKAHLIRNEIMQCSRCKRNVPLDFIIGNNYYCSCGTRQLREIKLIPSTDWVSLLDNGKLAIWRKKMKYRSEEGYIYKAKGYLEDVSAKDFLRVLLDLNYRQLWDKTTVELESINYKEKKSEIIYWKIRWPLPHKERDYVFRRQLGKMKRHDIYIVQNTSIIHPKYPEKPGVVRVNRYRSLLAVRPFVKITSPGLRYSLLFHEDPGEPYSTEMLMWFFNSGVHEFISAVHTAACALSKYKKIEKVM